LLICLRFAVSGGFAIIQPGSELDVNAVEGYPLEEFSIEVRSHCCVLLEAESVDRLTTFVSHIRLCMHK
jgi:F-type H+-transporting ATPase subunit delta